MRANLIPTSVYPVVLSFLQRPKNIGPGYIG